MCGRAYRKSPSPKLAKMFNAIDRFEESDPAFNMAPTANLATVRIDKAQQRELVGLYWGLIPPWVKDEGKRPFQVTNAKSETVHEKPMFKSAFAKKRCLVLFDGFYEWKREPIEGTKKTNKRPFVFHRKDQQPLAIAGLYGFSKTFDLDTCTLLTCGANGLMADVHTRMPCLLNDEMQKLWLDPEAPLEALSDLLRPAPDDTLVSYPVSTYVNNARNRGEECLTPLKDTADNDNEDG